jgi:hypothetical protein
MGKPCYSFNRRRHKLNVVTDIMVQDLASAFFSSYFVQLLVYSTFF